MAQEGEAQCTISFGTTQDRKLFPYYCAPDRLGNELAPLRGAPQRGPGCYENEAVSSFIYYLQKKPESKKGYTLGARTAKRFPPEVQNVAPAPTAYQLEWSKERTFKPSSAPFSISANRFQEKTESTVLTPGPGSYEHDVARNQKVSWPMKFDRPDWSLVPSLPKRTLRTELVSDKEFRKHRNRVAYLSLYYS
ncbi:protein pitchfork [Protopterus annectens]|uniref:protein pitchfork n=1 Tax=Protopterus annectens TaxID=7888 RepID=UPI001CFACECA|nr:protein pitchfork [Protopterus annectens]